MKKISKQLAEWLVETMYTKGLKNRDIIEAYKSKGQTLTTAYISNMRGSGMSLNKAYEIADIMGWPKPVVENGVVHSNQPGTEDTWKTSDETHVIISSLTLQADGNEILDKIQVSKPWLQATYPHLINLSELTLGEIKGDSMEPTFKEKDTILVDTGAQTVAIDGIYVFTYHDTLLIKRIQRIPGKGYSVISDNKEIYETFSIPNEDLEHLTVHGRVIGKFGFNKI